MADYITPEQARALQDQYNQAQQQANQLNQQYQNAMKGNNYPAANAGNNYQIPSYNYQATTGSGNRTPQQIVNDSYNAYMSKLQQISQNTGLSVQELQNMGANTYGYGTWRNGQLIVTDPNTKKTYISGGVTGGFNNTPGNGITGGGIITPTITQPEVTPGVEQPQVNPQANPQFDAFNLDNRDQINAMYDAQIAAQRAALQEQGDQALSDAQANRDNIAKLYNQQRNAASVEWERQRRNFLEGAATSGLNTGAGSQAELSMMSMAQREQNNLGAAQAGAEVEADRNIADIKRNTQAAINEAVAKNDYQRAAALLDEYQNIYNRYAERAEALASYGDFTGYAALYGNEIASQMFYNWAASNPQVAYMMGAISDQQYNNLMMGYPINAQGISYIGGTGTAGSTPALSDVLREQATQQRDRLIAEGYDPAEVQAAWEADMKQYNRL